MIKSKSLIPNGLFCYDENRICPYWREDSNIKADFYGYGHINSVWCDYLNTNSAVLDFEGVNEKDGSKCYRGHLLNDMCKICGINK